jgi:hypothetical protein
MTRALPMSALTTAHGQVLLRIAARGFNGRERWAVGILNFEGDLNVNMLPRAVPAVHFDGFLPLSELLTVWKQAQTTTDAQLLTVAL